MRRFIYFLWLWKNIVFISFTLFQSAESVRKGSKYIKNRQATPKGVEWFARLYFLTIGRANEKFPIHVFNANLIQADTYEYRAVTENRDLHCVLN